MKRASVALLASLAVSCGAESNSDPIPSDGGADAVADVHDAALPTLASCQPVAFEDLADRGACPFYECADAALGCGPDEYLIDFACRYADLYLAETYFEMSDAGQAFLESVFVCLQTSLEAEFDTLSDCESAAELGFASHVPCYLGAGFCELPLEDKLLVFAAIDPEDLEHPLQRAAQSEVIDRCSER